MVENDMNNTIVTTTSNVDIINWLELLNWLETTIEYFGRQSE